MVIFMTTCSRPFARWVFRASTRAGPVAGRGSLRDRMGNVDGRDPSVAIRLRHLRGKSFFESFASHLKFIHFLGEAESQVFASDPLVKEERRAGY